MKLKIIANDSSQLFVQYTSAWLTVQKSYSDIDRCARDISAALNGINILYDLDEEPLTLEPGHKVYEGIDEVIAARIARPAVIELANRFLEIKRLTEPNRKALI